MNIAHVNPWRLAAVTLVAILPGCSFSFDSRVAASPTGPDVRSMLVADGQSPEIADCVVRLGADQIDRSNYDELLESELISACNAANTVLEEGISSDRDSDEAQDFRSEDQPQDYGDDSELDVLWDACREGTGQACDDLFAQAPFDSAYEQFGLTCGNRPDILRCTDLDQVDEGPVPEVYVRG